MKKTVIVYEPAGLIKMLMRKSLAESDYELAGETGKTGELYKLADELKPDVIIADVLLRDFGDDAAFEDIVARLRKTNPKAKLVIVAERSIGKDTIKYLVEKHGADGYIEKPFQNEAPAKVLDEIFNA